MVDGEQPALNGGVLSGHGARQWQTAPGGAIAPVLYDGVTDSSATNPDDGTIKGRHRQDKRIGGVGQRLFLQNADRNFLTHA